MKKSRKKRSLALSILSYFILFSIAILIFLWVFQILCLNAFYKVSRKKIINNSINYLSKNYDEENFEEIFDEISINNDICIELVKNGKIEYTSSSIDKKCMSRNNFGLFDFQNKFILFLLVQ